MNLQISPLNKDHDRKSFDCGEESLNQYLRRYAGQDSERRISRIFVASPAGNPRQVIGYYSLCAGSLEAGNLPERLRRRLRRYPLPVPVAILGRLAVAKSLQGKKIGSRFLIDAFRRIDQASQVLAVHAVVVDALNDRAAGFYRQFGFIPLPSRPLKLFLPMATVGTLLRSSPQS